MVLVAAAAVLSELRAAVPLAAVLPQLQAAEPLAVLLLERRAAELRAAVVKRVTAPRPEAVRAGAAGQEAVEPQAQPALVACPAACQCFRRREVLSTAPTAGVSSTPAIPMSSGLPLKARAACGSTGSMGTTAVAGRQRPIFWPALA